MVYSVTKYGAVGDGATNDAAAIQSAIDACNAAGDVYKRQGKVRAIRFSTLDAICRELHCQPGDILEYDET